MSPQFPGMYMFALYQEEIINQKIRLQLKGEKKLEMNYNGKSN